MTWVRNIAPAFACSMQSNALAAERSLQRYGERLRQAGYGDITTEILDAPPFYYAEDYHQQYLAKNPQGYWALEDAGFRTKLP